MTIVTEGVAKRPDAYTKTCQFGHHDRCPGEYQGIHADGLPNPTDTGACACTCHNEETPRANEGSVSAPIQGETNMTIVQPTTDNTRIIPIDLGSAPFEVEREEVDRRLPDNAMLITRTGKNYDVESEIDQVILSEEVSLQYIQEIAITSTQIEVGPTRIVVYGPDCFHLTADQARGFAGLLITLAQDLEQAQEGR